MSGYNSEADLSALVGKLQSRIAVLERGVAAAPTFAEVLAEESTSSLTPADLTTPGPEIERNVGVGTLIGFAAIADMWQSGGVPIFAGVATEGLTPLDSDGLLRTANASVETRITVPGSTTGSLVGGGIIVARATQNVIRLKLVYFAAVGGTGHFKNRRIWLAVL